MRVAAIDLGTFSALLLIAELRRGRLHPLCEERRTVDLTCDRHGRLASEAIRRARRVLSQYETLARQHDVAVGSVAATAAVRAAVNRAAVVEQLRPATSFRVQVLSARREAALSARGALLGIRGATAQRLVIDLGGGSTEIVELASGTFRGLKIGAARATDQWIALAPKNPAARDLYYLGCADRALLSLNPDVFHDSRAIVGVGGTLTALAALAAGLRRFDAGAVHGRVLTADWIGATAATLARLPMARLRELLPFDPSRARVIVAGTYLWAAVLNRLSARRVTVSARGLRWGVAAQLAGLP
jgi:exopolyphosphatase/guanosine-5'-triphosphate,3'-diphosphate pyrophosphatase